MRKDSTHFTLTSAVGRFVFNKDVLLSHAKLVRDTITGEIRNPTTNSHVGETNAQNWLKSHVDGPIKHTQFRFIRS